MMENNVTKIYPFKNNPTSITATNINAVNALVLKTSLFSAIFITLFFSNSFSISYIEDRLVCKFSDNGKTTSANNFSLCFF